MTRLLVLILFFCESSFALINIEDVRPSRDEMGFKGDIKGSVDGTSGNTELFNIRTSGSLVWNTGPTQEFILGEYRLGESKGSAIIEKYLFHLRHVQILSDDWAIEAYYQMQGNEFTRLEFRGLLGAGVRWEFYKREKIFLAALGAGAFYSYERLKKVANDPEDDNRREGKFNFYLSIKKTLDPIITLKSTTYLQPKIDDWSDLTFSQDLMVKFNLYKPLALFFGVSVANDSRAPLTIEETDVSYQTGVQLRF